MNVFMHGTVEAGFDVLKAKIDGDMAGPAGEFVDEYRLFVLDNQVITASTYMLNKEFVGDRSQGLALNEKSIRFAERVIQHIKDRMPKSYVLDIGKLSTGEYAVIEFNPSWGSGIYGADPTLALKVIKNAVQNNSKCSPDAPGT